MASTTTAGSLVPSSTRTESSPNQLTRSGRSSGGVVEAGVSTAMTGQVTAPQNVRAKSADTVTP